MVDQLRMSSERSGSPEQGTDLVIDASAAVKAALVEDGFGVLAGHGLHGPTLLPSEVAAALSQLRWRAEISQTEAGIALDRFLAAGIRLHPSSDLVHAASTIAQRLGWPKTYDAEYVALATHLRIPLLTIDARLASAVGKLVDVWSPAG